MTVQDAIIIARQFHRVDVPDKDKAEAVRTLMEGDTSYFVMRKMDIWHVASWLYKRYKQDNDT